MIFLLYIILSLLPKQAQAVDAPSNFSELVGLVTDLIGLLTIIIFVLTMLVFFWGLIKNILLKGAEPENLKAGKSIMLWGIIVLVIMVSIWGILSLLQMTFFGI